MSHDHPLIFFLTKRENKHPSILQVLRVIVTTSQNFFQQLASAHCYNIFLTADPRKFENHGSKELKDFCLFSETRVSPYIALSSLESFYADQAGQSDTPASTSKSPGVNHIPLSLARKTVYFPFLPQFKQRDQIQEMVSLNSKLLRPSPTEAGHEPRYPFHPILTLS